MECESDLPRRQRLRFPSRAPVSTPSPLSRASRSWQFSRQRLLESSKRARPRPGTHERRDRGPGCEGAGRCARLIRERSPHCHADRRAACQACLLLPPLPSLPSQVRSSPQHLPWGQAWRLRAASAREFSAHRLPSHGTSQLVTPTRPPGSSCPATIATRPRCLHSSRTCRSTGAQFTTGSGRSSAPLAPVASPGGPTFAPIS